MALSRLPLFPLNVVLFPGVPLPLHVFEPRYRQLLADCLADDERFGIVCDESGTEEGLRESVGCVAHIRAREALPDGRSNIVVLGEQRFVVRALLDEARPYLVAEVEAFTDDDAMDPHHESLAALLELSARYVEALGVLNDTGTAGMTWATEPIELSFQVAALLETPLATKQQALALRSTRDRIQLLLSLLPALADEAAHRAVVHVGARSNGKGGAQPVIEQDS
jgi:Lon protease-like protein